MKVYASNGGHRIKNPYYTVLWMHIGLVITLAIQMLCLTKVFGCLPKNGAKPFFWLTSNSNDVKPLPQPNMTSSSNATTMEERLKWSTKDWIESWNYPLEQFNVTTVDGYQLTLHRLPRNGHRPILLVHGLMMSSLSWVIMGPNKSLALQLYDLHYDVWLANLRGSPDGRQHLTLNSSTDKDFWNFSFHEQGIADMPVIMDLVRQKSSFHQLIVITHSQAFNAMLVLCSTFPEYNDRIELMLSLAPIAALHDHLQINNEDVRKVNKFLKKMAAMQRMEVFPQDFLKENCLEVSEEKKKNCLALMRTFAGIAGHKQLDPLLFGNFLRGGSAKEITHLEQIWKSGDFVAFDYDVEGNLQYYKTIQPMSYNLSRVTVPMILYFGDTDALATSSGVHFIYSTMLSSVRGLYRINASKFNHIDFFLHKQVETLLNSRLINTMEMFLNGTLSYVIE